MLVAVLAILWFEVLPATGLKTKESVLPKTLSYTEEEISNALAYNPFTHHSVRADSGHEGILGSKDRRQRVNDPKTTQSFGKGLGSIGLLMTTFEVDGVKLHYGGTGTLTTNPEGKLFLLTCAHNFVYRLKRPPYDFRHAVAARFYPGVSQQSSWWPSTYAPSYVVLNYTIPESYFENRDVYDGYDFAIATLEQPAGTEIPSNFFAITAYTNKSELKHNELAVIGYPGEKIGMWGMKGHHYDVVEECTTSWLLWKTCKLKYIAYRDIDTSPGQSGSPLLAYLETDKCFAIIGIHVAYDRDNNYNVATVLTRELFDLVMKIKGGQVSSRGPIAMTFHDVL